MSQRIETLLWFAQRASAMVLAPLVLVHLATIVYAVHQGLSAAAILGRTRGNVAWLLVYGLFVAAVAVHAPIGLRSVIREMTPWRGRSVDLFAAGIAVLLVVLGWRAVAGLY